MSTHSNEQHADLLIHSGALWSGGRALGHTALAARDGVIVELGGDDLRSRYRAARVIDAHGGLVTPSFVDSHVHAALAGIEMIRCDLSSCESAEETILKILHYAAEHPDEEWILGGGWHMPHFSGGTPTKEMLDNIIPDRPVFLLNSDHHGAWVNSKALELAGIHTGTEDPADGRIERDVHGEPNGTLHEGAAEMVGSILPETLLAESQAGLLAAQELLFSYGITGWQEAILGAYGGYPDQTPAYQSMVDSGEMKARISGALWVSRDFDGLTIPDFVAELKRRRAMYEREGLRLHTAKIMVDGVPENETAAMEDPYAHRSAGCACIPSTGLSYFSSDELCELVPLLNGSGFDVHFHAIGDRAVRYALDAVAAVPKMTRESRRNHIAHVQIVNPEDYPRFSQLRVTVNAQPLWACRDDQMVELTLPLLGRERTEWQYPFASLLKHGATIACGSDWPVSTPDPWQGIHVAVTRQEPACDDAEPLVLSERLELGDILNAYTRQSHQLLGLPGGALAVGEVCDLAIADRNPFHEPENEIYRTQNVATVLGGKVVYTSPQ